MKNTTTKFKSIGPTLPIALSLLCFLFPTVASSQVGVGTTTPKAALEIASTDSGMLVPRVALTSTANALPVTNPQGGALEISTLVYNTANVAGATGVSPGFYFWNGTAWIGISASKGWSLTGDASTVQPAVPATYGTTPIATSENFVGTTDNLDFVFGTANLERMRIKNTGRVGIGTSTPTGRFNVFAPNQTAIVGETFSTIVNASAVYGRNYQIPGSGIGVYGLGGSIGVEGYGQSYGGTATTVGVRGMANGYGGRRIGGYFSGENGSFNHGLIVPEYGGNVGFGISSPDRAQLQVQGAIGNTVATFNEYQNSFGISLVTDWPGIYFNSYYNAGVRQMAPTGYAGFLNFDPTAGNFSFNVNSNPNTVSGNVVTGTIGNQMTISRNNGAYIGYPQNVAGLTVTSGGQFCDLAYYGPVEVNNGHGIDAAGTAIGVEGKAQFISPTAIDRIGGIFYVSGYNGGPNYQVPAMGAVGAWIDNIAYKIIGYGAVSTLVKDDQHKDRIMVAPEAPEALFQDYGVGTLVNGHAKIDLDPILSRNIRVDSSHPVKIFIQPEGKCKGLYVFNKSATGFEVGEQEDGQSNVTFSYQIVAYRADEDRGGVIAEYSQMRFKPMNREFKERKNEWVGKEEATFSGMSEMLKSTQSKPSPPAEISE
ncbi:MAG: hypothetical protein EOO50_10915 [Flavobacterium sp.]|uniref:hypothetical protein n=1 Tax=Flavobacterium sp. TaxID=239 RepID=UPI00121E6B5C|nr:hypothetical protein [Flavobacterium sp.]RZJ66168.1 MAG: hypothetical protein EOO50_10915 [Flavobacterium sp.]